MNWRKKNVYKVIRSIIEAVVLIILLMIIIRALFSFNTYEPYREEEAVSNSGFIALSYFGVDRTGNSTLTSTKRLDEHLKALYKQGYVTITGQDIKDYFETGKALPEKALFLIFEDGRNETAIFAQNIMEKYNYKGTIMTYAQKLEENSSKFLKGEDLKKLLDSTFWELGTNGYRLSYINVFDGNHNYFGEMSEEEYAALHDDLGKEYNHYLMDYIRDKDGIPKESYKEMYKRISDDYEKMERMYEDEVGEVPQLYMLMHANTGKFGTNNRVSEVNEEWIKRMFQMNFNREGNSWNTHTDKLQKADSALYNLTRMQIQPDWYSNHLLMRIKYDTKQDLEFMNGIQKQYDKWTILEGALECKPEKAVLTSIPKGAAKILLKGDRKWKNFRVQVTLTGNTSGSQSIYLRADNELTTYVSVSFDNHTLYIKETSPAGEKELFKVKLMDADESKLISKSEISKAKIDIEMSEDNISVWVDDILTADKVRLSEIKEGTIGLGCEWVKEDQGQKYTTDDVYDGVFEKLSVTTLPHEKNKTETLYDNHLHGLDKVNDVIRNVFNSVINWFIKYL